MTDRGQAKADRRQVNDAVLDSHRPVHRLAEAITAKVVDEARPLVPDGSSGSLAWDEFTTTWWRVVLGDAARDDQREGVMTEQVRVSGDERVARLIQAARELIDALERKSTANKHFLSSKRRWTRGRQLPTESSRSRPGDATDHGITNSRRRRLSRPRPPIARW